MKFNKKEEEDYSLQLTALIDVVFLLLIFFMVSTAFVDFTRRVDIELPESSAGAAMEKTKIYEIEITESELIFVNGKKISFDSLKELLLKKDRSIKKRSALIRADKDLSYGIAVKVMGLCQSAGITDIGIAVR